MDSLAIKKAVLVGWSLGGNIAMQLMADYADKVQGVFMSGSPAMEMSDECVKAAFKPFDGFQLLGKAEQFTQEEAVTFVSIVGLKNAPNEIIQAAKRTHGAARQSMFASALNGTGSCNQKLLLSEIPVGIVMGKHDEGINNDFIRESSSKYKNLKLLAELDTGHATLWSDPEGFNANLVKFIEAIS